jgi:hypothetical protein
MALSKGSILKHAGSFKAREVHVPAWADESGDDVVLVRGMTVREFELNQGSADDGKASARVIARCVIDESGGRVFDSTDADVNLIAELPLAQVMLLNQAIAQASGLGDDADTSQSAVDKGIADAEKNSDATSDGDSSSS